MPFYSKRNIWVSFYYTLLPYFTTTEQYLPENIQLGIGAEDVCTGPEATALLNPHTSCD